MFARNLNEISQNNKCDEDLYQKISKATMCCQIVTDICEECPYYEIKKENDGFEACQAQYKKDLDKVLREDLHSFIRTLEGCAGYKDFACLKCVYGKHCLEEFCVSILHEHASFLMKTLTKAYRQTNSKSQT